MSKIIVGITLGDPAGIGPEVATKALLQEEIYKIANPVLIGDAELVRRYLPSSFNLNIVRDVNNCKFNYKTIDLISSDTLRGRSIKLGEPQALCGELAYAYINKAIKLISRGEIKAIVTSPISKLALHLAGYNYPGHTELLGALTASIVRMAFILNEFRVVLVTTHIPLKKVSTQLTQKKIQQTIKIFHFYLKKYFGISQPNIGVCGLNPHAGEQTTLGKEEEKKIIPAIERLKKKIRVEGPYPADMLFAKYIKERIFDGVVAIYHDQGLIPLKLLNWEECVNLTLGLPFIRTSPAHGTAYDIAGKCIASEKSMVAAILLAAKLASQYT